MYDLYEARNSIYCYENTDILKNKLNIKDKEKLYDYERKIVLAKLFILRPKSNAKISINSCSRIYMILQDYLEVKILQKVTLDLQNGNI